MVPTLTCGLSRVNFSFATFYSLLSRNRSEANPCRLPRLCGDRLTGATLNHPLSDVGRHFLVLVELHRVRRPALGHRPYVGRVPEHLAQRDVCRHNLRVAARRHTVDAPAATVEVADHVAHVLLRRDHLDREDRL